MKKPSITLKVNVGSNCRELFGIPPRRKINRIKWLIKNKPSRLKKKKWRLKKKWFKLYIKPPLIGRITNFTYPNGHIIMSKITDMTIAKQGRHKAGYTFTAEPI